MRLAADADHQALALWGGRPKNEHILLRPVGGLPALLVPQEQAELDQRQRLTEQRLQPPEPHSRHNIRH